MKEKYFYFVLIIKGGGVKIFDTKIQNRQKICFGFFLKKTCSWNIFWYNMYMNFLIKILPTLQVIISILLIISVLLQQTGVGSSNGLEGSNTVVAKTTRRGLEKFLLKFTTVLAILFFLIAIVNLLVK